MYWKGSLPSPVAEVVRRYDGPINVEVHEDAPYSDAELQPRADRLVNEPWLALAAGVDLVRVGWPSDGTGVTAGVLATVPPPDLAGASAFLGRQLGVPVALTVEEPFGFAGRKNDSPPWYAGGRTQTHLQDDKYIHCSTGWGIRTGEGETAKDFVLTAAHCSGKDKKVHNGDRSREIGTVSDVHKELDSAIVPVVSASVNMFTGRPTSATILTMEKAIEVKVGAWVCDSGASTGQNCDIKVDGVNEKIEADIGWVKVTTTVHKDAEGIAGGKGDSGGPVYLPVEKQQKVQAVGVVVATRSEVPCRADDDCAECNRRMAFAPIGALLAHWKATLIAGG